MTQKAIAKKCAAWIRKKAVFKSNITIVKAVAEKKPYYAVFRDRSMVNDSFATNFDQIFASISPETVRKVL